MLTSTGTMQLTAEAVSSLLDAVYPQINADGHIFTVTAVSSRSATLRMAAHQKNLRPGGTISGPAMFMLADLGIYAAILATLGPSAVDAVTTNLNITFLSRPKFGDLIAETRLLRVGRRLVVADVALLAASDAVEPVAHAVGTYARPQK